MKWLRKLLARADSSTQPRRAMDAPRADDGCTPAALREQIANLLSGGMATEALATAQEAADRYPHDVEINVLCGKACLAVGDAESALDAFQLAAHYEPGSEGALKGRIAALTQLGRTGEIVRAFDELLAARPHHAGALHALARMASEAGDSKRALELLDEVVRYHPEHIGALNDLGLLLAREFADFARGEGLLRRALALAPSGNHARLNLAWVLCEQRAYDEGFRLMDAAVASDPENQEARLMRSVARLKRGEFAAGWDEYEARNASPTAHRRPFAFPVWDGSPLGQGRLLVYGEQGLGDQILFASCLPDVLERAPEAVLECEPRLGTLFARSFPSVRIVTGSLIESAPDWLKDAGSFDRQVALGSLPRLFRRQAADFPTHAGYLRADPVRVRTWRERLAARGAGVKIGISWRGGTYASRGAQRSVELARFAPLVNSIDATWVSLQYSDCREELSAFSREQGVAVHHWQEAIDDYDETAALVSALDLVVTVCTSIVDLSGSLGQRAIVMVPYAADWRYGAAGATMPWYPSVKLFRQREPGDWNPVLEAVRRELLTGEATQA